MLLKDFVMDLQLFAEVDPDNTAPEEEGEALEGLEGDGESATPQPSEDDTQVQIDRIIDRKFKQWNRRLTKQFGTSDLDHIADVYRAGAAVSRASGLAPTEVVGKLEGAPTSGNPGNAGNPAQGQPDLYREIQSLKNIVLGQHHEKVIEQQRTEARKEFGKLFDEYEMEIEDLAEERDLSLSEAALLVLRPHLGSIYQERQLAQSQNRRKKVDSSEGAPAKGGTELVGKLTSTQKSVAKGLGLSLSDYAQQLKELGQLE